MLLVYYVGYYFARCISMARPFRTRWYKTTTDSGGANVVCATNARPPGSGPTAVLVSHASIIIPFCLGTTLSLLIYRSMAPPSVPFTAFATGRRKRFT